MTNETAFELVDHFFKTYRDQQEAKNYSWHEANAMLIGVCNFWMGTMLDEMDEKEFHRWKIKILDHLIDQQ